MFLFWAFLTIKKLDWILDFVLDFVHFPQGWRKRMMSAWEPKWTGTGRCQCQCQWHFYLHFHLQRADYEMVARAVSDRQSYHHVDGEIEAQQGSEHIVLACVDHRWQSLGSSKFQWVVQSNQRYRSLDFSSKMMKILVEEATTIIIAQYNINCSKGTIKHTLRRKAEAKDAKTKWPKKAMIIKITKIAPDGMEN